LARVHKHSIAGEIVLLRSPRIHK